MATRQTKTLARLMVAPAVILLLVWMVVPLAMTLWFSFLNYNSLHFLLCKHTLTRFPIEPQIK